MLFKRKPTIKFTSLIPGVEKIMPIIEAKDFKHQWMDRAHEEFTRLRKDQDVTSKRFIHTTRCPALFGIQRLGWILRTWQDISIETAGAEGSFIWHSVIDQSKIHPAHTHPAISSHPPHQYYQYQQNFPENTLHSVIKINTPWVCAVPKGYHLLEMPVPYLDDNRFTTMTGVFSHEHGPAPLNVQMLWHVLHGKTVIKAGTPIAQYILVKKDSCDLEVDAIESVSEYKLAELLKEHRYMANYAEIRSFFKET